jgi:hypothetical protein
MQTPSLNTFWVPELDLFGNFPMGIFRAKVKKKRKKKVLSEHRVLCKFNGDMFCSTKYKAWLFFY